jgi:hypothetical protein
VRPHLQGPPNKDIVKVFRNGNAAEAFQWLANEGRWVKIGDVVDSAGSSTKAVRDATILRLNAFLADFCTDIHGQRVRLCL